MLTVFAATNPVISEEEELLIMEIDEQVKQDQAEAARRGMTLDELYDYYEDLQLDAELQG
jgi:hypothetical protein